jgi:DNA modification methylase
MKIVLFSGSRNRNGQTARAVDAFSRGIVDGGGKAETLFLVEFKLELCRQCNNDGWGICTNEARCIIEDDFASLAEKIEGADALIFASPVYFGDLSESLRGFLERYRRTHFNAIFRRQRIPRGAPGLPPIFVGGTPVIGFCYAGGSGNGTVSCAASLERMLQTCGFDVVDMVLARRQNLEMKLPLLESVGKWMITKPESGPWPPPPLAR